MSYRGHTKDPTTVGASLNFSYSLDENGDNVIFDLPFSLVTNFYIGVAK